MLSGSHKFRVTLALFTCAVFVLACQLASDTVAEEIPTPISAETTSAPATATPLPKSPTPRPTITSTPVPVRVFATAKSDAQVRAAPATNAAVVDRLAKGNALQVVGRTQASDWWQVALPTKPNQVAWISAQVVTLNSPTDSIPVVNALGTPQAPTATPSPKATASPKAGTPSITPKATPTATPNPVKPTNTPSPRPTQTKGATRPTFTPGIPSWMQRTPSS